MCDLIGSPEQSQDSLPIYIPKGRRERRRIWAVLVDNRQHRDRYIYGDTGNDRREDDVSECVLDATEGNDEACQEKEDGGMEERWDGLHGDGQLEAGGTLGKEGPNEGTIMDSELRPGESEVSASPALLEHRQQSTKEAHDEAQTPEGIDPDGRGRWLPATSRQWKGRARSPAGKGPIRDTVELLGYLGEEDHGGSRRVG